MTTSRFVGGCLLMLGMLGGTASAASHARLVDAVMHQDGSAVQALLAGEVDVNAPQADGATALHWAAHWDDLALVERLLRAGAAVDATNDLGVTPLWLACVNASPSVVEALLAADANPNLPLPSGETPLMTAVRTGDAQVVKMLLARGADVNARERHQGQTALMWAAAGRFPDIVRVLIESGADVHARSLVRRRRIGTERNGFNGAAARDVDKGGYTPLLFAAQQGNLESVELLLAAGAKVDDADPEGTSALVVATHSGHGPVSAFLLDRGADPNAAAAGYSALHAAILRGNVDLVKRLVSLGADPNAPLVKATPVRRNSADYGLEFDTVGATPFWLAARYLEPEIMRVLVDAGADSAITLKGGITPIIAAVGARRREEPGLTADRVRDEELIMDVVTIAAERGVDVNATVGDGNTAMHTAASRGLNQVIERLAERGARVDVKNKKGLTPLALALATATRGGVGSAEGLGAKATEELLRKLGATE